MVVGSIVILFCGLIAGWLAVQILHETGFGIVGDVLVGVFGALVGSRLLPLFGIQFGGSFVSAIITATLGAAILLVLIRLLRGGELWRGSPGGGL
jgi:uncharacterized membrane protein YeaQ/YmgE (transglycosylase-associated protein family)